MKTVTVETVRARLSYLEELNARGVGTAVPQQQFETACLRELLALLVCRLMPITVKLPAGYVVRPGHPINEGERGVMIPKDDGTWLSRFDVEHILQVAGIQVIEGEG